MYRKNQNKKILRTDLPRGPKIQSNHHPCTPQQPIENKYECPVSTEIFCLLNCFILLIPFLSFSFLRGSIDHGACWLRVCVIVLDSLKQAGQDKQAFEESIRKVGQQLVDKDAKR